MVKLKSETIKSGLVKNIRFENGISQEIDEKEYQPLIHWLCREKHCKILEQKPESKKEHKQTKDLKEEIDKELSKNKK